MGDEAADDRDGNSEREFAYDGIRCVFCSGEESWQRVSHFETRRPNSAQRLNFDTLECGHCEGYVLLVRSSGLGLNRYRILPWPLRSWRLTLGPGRRSR